MGLKGIKNQLYGSGYLDSLHIISIYTTTMKGIYAIFIYLKDIGVKNMYKIMEEKCILDQTCTMSLCTFLFLPPKNSAKFH